MPFFAPVFASRDDLIVERRAPCIAHRMATPSPTDIDIRPIRFERGDEIPNHPRWPLLLYRQAVPRDASEVERLLTSNGWGGAWRNGVFPYHHYHTVAHEVLAVVRGSATVQFGGPQGEAVELAAGDVAILPAGTGHKRVDASDDFLVVGAYPKGQEDYDTQRQAPGPEELANIERAPRPAADPVFGAEGPLMAHWTE